MVSLQPTLPAHPPMLPALDPDTTRGSRLDSSSARTTPKCLRQGGGRVAGIRSPVAGEVKQGMCNVVSQKCCATR